MTMQMLLSAAAQTYVADSYQADFSNLEDLSITSHVHNLALPPVDKKGYRFETNGGTRDLTGIVAPVEDHFTIALFNHSSTHMHILHNNGGSSSGNRILCPNQQDFWLDARTVVYAQYSISDGYWFLISPVKA